MKKKKTFFSTLVALNKKRSQDEEIFVKKILLLLLLLFACEKRNEGKDDAVRFSMNFSQHKSLKFMETHNWLY